MLRDVVNIQHWLDNDPETAWRDRLVRDREIDLSNPVESPHNSQHGLTTTEKLARVLYWWQQVNGGQHADTQVDSSISPGHDVEAFFNWATMLTALLGCLLGGSAAMTVLHYNGTSPINVLVVLGCLILAPLITLVGSLFLPFISPRSALGSINLGAIVQSAIRVRYRHLDENFSLTSPGIASPGMEKYFRWRLMFNSQVFGLAFSLAALAVLLFKVALTDLAFAWGTTLSIGSEGFYSAVRIIAAPWASFLPQAVPDQVLIAASRYYRLGDNLEGVSAAALTGWWLFVAMSLAVYGVLLRSILLVIALQRTRAALQYAFLNHPQLVALVERLNTSLITSVAETTEEVSAGHQGHNLASDGTLDAPARVFSWHQAPVPRAIRGNEISVQMIDLGNERDINEHVEPLNELAKEHLSVWFICKGWEPPLLECHDVLQALRASLGPSPAIVVTPVDEEGVGSVDEDKNMWRESLAKLNDPHLYVQ